MARVLAAVVLLWPLTQAASVAAAIKGSDGTALAIVRAVGSHVCHQRPERSFYIAGVQWPVCARCTGLYLGAGLGVWFGFARSLRRWVGTRRMVAFLALASTPTVVTWIAEWGLRLGITNAARAAAALPLGAAVGAAIVAVASSTSKRNQVN